MRKSVIALAFTATLFTPLIASAQDAAYVEKLERRLMALEQKIYNLPAPTEGAAAPAQNNAMLADFEARLQSLEEESGKVYGAVEELGNTVEKFAKKMEMISKDFDLRLQDIEKELEEGAVAAKSAPAPTSAPVSADKAALAKNYEKMTDRVSAKAKGAAKVAPKAAAVAAKSVKAAASLSGFPEDMSAKDHYDAAYKLIVATKYKDAEAAMNLFLSRHGDDELADNAYYWLGEVYLVQNMPEKAVITFSKGLAKFPKGQKSAGNLLKMGVAFKQMKKNDFAKSSWSKLLNDYPESPEAEKAKKELEKL